MGQYEVANNIGIIAGFYDCKKDAEELRDLLARDFPEEGWTVYKLY